VDGRVKPGHDEKPNERAAKRSTTRIATSARPFLDKIRNRRYTYSY
jgi:hypothetical protein